MCRDATSATTSLRPRPGGRRVAARSTSLSSAAARSAPRSPSISGSGSARPAAVCARWSSRQGSSPCPSTCRTPASSAWPIRPLRSPSTWARRSRSRRTMRSGACPGSRAFRSKVSPTPSADDRSTGADGRRACSTRRWQPGRPRPSRTSTAATSTRARARSASTRPTTSSSANCITCCGRTCSAAWAGSRTSCLSPRCRRRRC